MNRASLPLLVSILALVASGYAVYVAEDTRETSAGIALRAGADRTDSQNAQSKVEPAAPSTAEFRDALASLAARLGALELKTGSALGNDATYGLEQDLRSLRSDLDTFRRQVCGYLFGCNVFSSLESRISELEREVESLRNCMRSSSSYSSYC